MIRMRFVAMLGVFALFVAGVATYELHRRPAPAFIGATDHAHVAAAKAMLKSLSPPAGMAQDPYGTGCEIASAYCFTSSSVTPEAAAATMTTALVSVGGRVRSHVCGGARLVQHACEAIVDYQGSRIDLIAGPNLRRPGNASTHLRLTFSGADPSQPASASAPFGTWASVDPLPPAWTTGVTCTKPSGTGCFTFDQQIAGSPLISATTAQACATVRHAMEGRYNLAVDSDRPATATSTGGCTLLGHRYRTPGGRDGELLAVLVHRRDVSHIAVRVTMETAS